jgi:hypothetical protein
MSTDTGARFKIALDPQALICDYSYEYSHDSHSRKIGKSVFTGFTGGVRGSKRNKGLFAIW